MEMLPKCWLKKISSEFIALFMKEMQDYNMYILVLRRDVCPRGRSYKALHPDCRIIDLLYGTKVVAVATNGLLMDPLEVFTLSA